MATTILNPSADVSGDWVLSTGSDYYAILDYGDNNHVSTGQIGRSVRMEYDDFTDSFDSITSVQACITGHRGGRSGTHDVTVDIENASNTNYYSDTHTITVNGGNPATYCSSAYTTSDGGSTNWTNSDLNGLRIYFQSDETNADGVVIYSAYINVVYTVPSLSLYTSDDNVILSQGVTEIKNGKVEIKGR